MTSDVKLDTDQKEAAVDKTTSQEGALNIYKTVRAMTISFQLPPGERINEGKLAKQLGVSRTPLREAMQKLVTEKLLRWERNKGFFCRMLKEQEVFDLYEYRRILEEQSARLACKRASREELLELKQYVADNCNASEENDYDRLLDIDQHFHEGLAKLSGNNELWEALQKINQRIYFIRWIDMAGRRSTTQSEHMIIIDALIEGEADRAAAIMSQHVERRLEQISECIQKGYGMIYTGNTPKLSA